MFSVRRLHEDDFYAFRKLQLRALKDHPESLMLDYDEASVEPEEQAKRQFMSRVCFGAFVADELVGYAGLNRHRGKKVRHKAGIGGVYVAPEMRGRGIARRMIEAAIEEAKTKDIELLLISANSSHPATIGLYKSLGFEPYGIEKHILKLADGSYVDDVLMMQFIK
jgi:ribosomal protein S18 acetylase RimI-like enzyme